MHFDLRAPGAGAAEVSRLQKLEATVVRRYPGHTTMRDAEGNVFCVEPGPRVMAWRRCSALTISVNR